MKFKKLNCLKSVIGKCKLVKDKMVSYKKLFGVFFFTASKFSKNGIVPNILIFSFLFEIRLNQHFHTNFFLFIFFFIQYFIDNLE